MTGAQQGGNSLFANSIQSRNSGVTLNVMARVNPMGIVTHDGQSGSECARPPDPGAAIQSPSFSKRTVQTQVTLSGRRHHRDRRHHQRVECRSSSAGIPVLHRIPVLGCAFGSKSFTKERTELIIFLTPRVIYDMNNMNEASEELKSRLKKLSRYVKDEM